MADPPSGSVAFLFTDIEGSTRRWIAHPAEMQAAVARHDELVRTAVERHDGFVFSTAGDSFAVAFETVRASLAAAADLQRSLAANDWRAVEGLAVRAGVHVGEAERRGGDYFGPELSRAARIMDAAHGGQVLVSAAAAALAGGWSLLDLGEHALRDLPTPERIHQLLGEGLAAEFPPPRSLSQVHTSLPVQHSSFVGRHEEVSRLRAMVAGHRLVTLAGTGGTGKTRLAIEAAARERDSFEGGVLFVDLAAVTDAAQLAAALASGVGARTDPAGPVLTQVLAHLEPRRALVVVDNCEQLLDDVADVVLAVLDSCPSVKVLATSREPLGVPGEQVFRVPSLTARSDGDDLAPAVRLFLDRATAVNPDLPVDAATHAQIVEVCERLDGIPLAIELAASRCRVLSPGDLVAHLNDRFLVLSGGTRRSRHRQSTMETAVDWSYRLLDDDEQRAFRTLSVFVGPFDLEDAAAILDLPVGAALEILDSLTSKSLVTTDMSSGHARHRLLETLRAFGQLRLVEAEEGAAARDRHLAHLASQLRPLEQYGAHSLTHLRWMEAHHDDLMLAAGWAEGTGRHEELGVLASGMFGLWLAQHRPTGADLLDRALAGDMTPSTRCRVLYTRAIAAMVAMDIERWIECTSEGVPLSEGLQPVSALMRYHHAFLMVAGLPELCEAHIADAQSELEGVGGHLLGELIGHMYRGMVQVAKFDAEGALRSVAAMDRLYPPDDGAPLLSVVASTTNVSALLLLGQADEAAAVAEGARATEAGIWLTPFEVVSAVALAAAGRTAEAEAALVRQAGTIDPTAFPLAADTLITGFGLLAYHRGDGERARVLLDDALGVRSPQLFVLLLDALAALDGAPPSERARRSEAARARRALTGRSSDAAWLEKLGTIQPARLAEELARLTA